jgi:hypothetical protein
LWRKLTAKNPTKRDKEKEKDYELGSKLSSTSCTNKPKPIKQGKTITNPEEAKRGKTQNTSVKEP